jgi:TalC/MipB family fructose-6-phosphate aldolase
MLYLDSADLRRIEPMLATGLFDGVTTNPVILDRAGLASADVPRLVADARGLGARRSFAQATGGTRDELRASAHAIAELGDDVVVKLVATRDGLAVARELADAGRETLVTAVYHPAQALLAEAAGATWIAPYVGRATSAGRDGVALVAGLAAATGTGRGDRPAPRILAASLRDADQVAAVAAAGAHDVTVSIDIAEALLADALTLAAADEFETVVAASRATPTTTLEEIR